MLNWYDAVQPAMQGNLQQAFWNMWAWASMPDSPLKGNHMSMTTAINLSINLFNNAVNTLPECQH